MVVLTLFTERQDIWIGKIAYLFGNMYTVEPYIKIKCFPYTVKYKDYKAFNPAIAQLRTKNYLSF